MAKKDLQNVLLALSRNPSGVVESAGLSEAELALINEGDLKKIRIYLGDNSVSVQIKFRADLSLTRRSSASKPADG